MISSISPTAHQGQITDAGSPFPPALLATYAEAAQRLRISKSSLRILVDAGEITPIRIGRSVRFPISELRRYVAEQMESAGAAPIEGAATSRVKQGA